MHKFRMAHQCCQASSNRTGARVFGDWTAASTLDEVARGSLGNRRLFGEP